MEREELRLRIAKVLKEYKVPLSAEMKLNEVVQDAYEAGIKKCSNVLIEHIQGLELNDDTSPDHRLGQIEMRDKILKRL